MSEHDEQSCLIQWAYHYSGLPELKLLFAIPNAGVRHYATARRMKAEGLRAGLPDLALMVARQGYYGLFIELKYGKNKPTEEQKWWLEQLTQEGYKACVCYGFEEAKQTLEEYLS